MKNSYTEGSEQRTSPRVAAVLQTLVSNGLSQRKLAEDAGLSCGVVNQLALNKTRSTANLVGRMCAVLDRDDAAALLAAFLADISEAVAKKQKEAIDADCPNYGATLKVAKFAVLFPPTVVGSD
jgi:transcriptional regulator with XRE-family HTH domain